MRCEGGQKRGWEGKECEKGRKEWIEGMEEGKRDGFDMKGFDY